MRSAFIFYYFSALFLVTSFATAQPLPRKQIKGKVTSTAYDLSGIYIVNKYSRENTVTISEGYFAINARPGDTLIFSDINFIGRQIAVTKENYDGELLYLRMAAIANQIDEVIVNPYKNINAVSLGILPKQPRSFSKAERGAKAGVAFEGQIGTNSSIGLDPLINAITGRRKELIANLDVERKLVSHSLLEKYFSDEYFLKQMNIPESRVEGFKFYLVENAQFSSALKSGNKTLASWLMAALAAQYNNLEKVERKPETD